ncbi:unnamed protein product [Allacma fusca]|uniref:Uncharacterized protein n=1 Tax=Allacma fusca TaxID=39272 RepID=A0A8J2JQZ0_9HEXA|nr:unnamed protein product [Allacma fusca]
MSSKKSPSVPHFSKIFRQSALAGSRILLRPGGVQHSCLVSDFLERFHLLPRTHREPVLFLLCSDRVLTHTPLLIVWITERTNRRLRSNNNNGERDL